MKNENNLKLHFLDVESFDNCEFFTGIIPCYFDNEGKLVKKTYIKLNNNETINYLRALTENDIVIAYNDRYDYNAIYLSGIENYSNERINDVLIRTKNEDLKKRYKYTSFALKEIGGSFKTYDVMSLFGESGEGGKLKVVARQKGFIFTSSSSVNVEEYNIEDIEATLYLFEQLKGIDEIKAYLYLLDEYNLTNIRCLNNNLIVSQIMKQLSIDKESISERIPSFEASYNNFLESINHPVARLRESLYQSDNNSTKSIDLQVGKYKVQINQGGLHSPSGTVFNNKKYNDVILADFASLYPTCYTSEHMPEDVIPNETKIKLTNLINERVSIKKTDPVKAHALKIILNTIYGQLKTNTESLTPIVTVLSQMALIDLIQGLYNIDNDILFIDYNTDGIYFKSDKKEECIKYCENHKSYWTNPEVSKVEVETADILYYKDTNNYAFVDKGKVNKIKGAWIYNKGFSYTVGRDTENKEITFGEVYNTYDNLVLKQNEIKTLYAPKIYNFKDIIIAGLQGDELPSAKLMAGYKTYSSAEYFDLNISDSVLDLIDETDTIKISNLKQRNYKGIFEAYKTTSEEIGKVISKIIFDNWINLTDNLLSLDSLYVVADSKINPKKEEKGYTYYTYQEAINFIASMKGKNSKKLIKLHLSNIKGVYVYDLDFKYLKDKEDLTSSELLKGIRAYKNNFNKLEEFLDKLNLENFCIEYNKPTDMIKNRIAIRKTSRFGCHIYLNRELTDVELKNLELFITDNFQCFHQIEDKTKDPFITLYESVSDNSLKVNEFVSKYAEFDIKERVNNCVLDKEHIDMLKGFFYNQNSKVDGHNFCVKCQNADHSSNPLSLHITFDKSKNKFTSICFVCNTEEKELGNNNNLLNRLNTSIINKDIKIENTNNTVYLDDRGTGSGKSYDMAKTMYDTYESGKQIIAIFNTKDNISNFIDILKSVDLGKYYDICKQIMIITADELENLKTSVFTVLTEIQPKIIFILGCYFKTYTKGIDDEYLLKKDTNNYFNEESLYEPLKNFYMASTLFIDEADVFINNVLSRVVETGIFYNSKITYNKKGYKINIEKFIDYLFSKEGGYKFKNNVVSYNSKPLQINDNCKNGLINHFKFNKKIEKVKNENNDEEDKESKESKDLTELKNLVKFFQNYTYFQYDKNNYNNGLSQIKIKSPIDVLNKYFDSINENILDDESIFEFLNKDYKIQPINESCIGLGNVDNSDYYIYKTNSDCIELLEKWKGNIYLATATAELVKQVFPNYELTKKAQESKNNNDNSIIKCNINKIDMGGTQYKKLMRTKINLHNRLKSLTLNQHLTGLCNILTVRGAKDTAVKQQKVKGMSDDAALHNQTSLIDANNIITHGTNLNIENIMAITYLRNPSIRGSNDYKDFPLFFYDINTVNTNERFLNAIDVKNIYNLKTRTEREEYANNIIEKDRQQAYGRMDRGETDKLAFIFLNPKGQKGAPQKTPTDVIKEIESHLNYTLLDKLDYIGQNTWDDINKFNNMNASAQPSYSDVYNYFKINNIDFIGK